MSDQLFYIWSWEHKAWWMPRERGYTSDINTAGQYPYEQALEICKAANYSFNNEYGKMPNEGIVLVPRV